jgi:hypothetical protein
MKTIDEIREAFLRLKISERAGESFERQQVADALTLMGAVDELAGLRAGKAVLDKFSNDGHTDLARAAVQAIADFYKSAAETLQAQPLPLPTPDDPKRTATVFGCVHGRPVGRPCPHCLGIGSGQ